MINYTDCILIMGRRGCGKSFLAKKVQELFPRKIVIDSLNEYTEGNIVSNFDQFTQKLLEFKERDSFTLVYQFSPESPVSDEEFNQIMRVSYYFENVQVVIEEIQLYSSPHYLPHWLKNSLLTGRHKGMSLLFTTQRPGELNKTILSQCSHIFCGQIIEGNDLRYISSFLNEDAERLSSIPKRKFLYRSDSGTIEINNDFSKLRSTDVDDNKGDHHNKNQNTEKKENIHEEIDSNLET